MRLFLEIIFRNLYYFLRDAHTRTFYLLTIRLGGLPRYVKKTIGVDGYKIKLADPLSFIYQYREIFVDQSYNFKTDKSAPTIVDCGSNIGLAAVYYKSIYPNAKVFCIEADQEIAKICEENIQNNRLTNVEVIAKAAWIHDDGVSFSSDGADGGTISAEANNKIPSLDLKKYLESFDVIDFLKIDIEGAEKIVVPHCADAFKNISNVFLEYHTSYSEQQNLGEILSQFQAMGFKYFIKNENKRKSPFINKNIEKNFDLQLNIFFYK